MHGNADARNRPSEPARENYEDWSDGRLVEACLRRNDRAWSELINRYQRLILSIGLKGGLSITDAFDVSQRVWTQAYLKLSSLRKADSVRPWLTTLARNSCHEYQRQSRQRRSRELDGYEPSDLEDLQSLEPIDLVGSEQRKRVEDAVARLDPRCRRMVEMLFFSHPRPTYREIAREFQLADGSVSAIRERCLKRLLALLES